MALTPEQRARLQALTSGQQAAPATAPATAPSRLTPEQRAQLQTFTGTATQDPAPVERDGALYRAASFVNRGVEKFANLPVIKQVGQATGAALGGVGGVIGGGVAAVGTPIVNIARGRPVFENYGAQIKKNAMDTGGFGFQLGEQAPTLGAMQTLGRAPNLVLGAAQTLEGYKQTREALESGDTAGAIQAGITTGIGAAGTLLGLRQKGLFLDEGFKTGTKARLKGISVDELNTQKYTRVMEDVLQPNKSTVKRGTKGILAQARKERAGMSVEPQKTTARVLVEEGVVPGTVDEGGTTKFRTAEQVVDMDNRVAYANDKLEQALALDPNPQFDLEAKKLEAVKSVDSIQNVSATEKKAMRAEIEKLFDDEIEERGQFVDGSQYNQIKRGFANAGDYKNLTPGQKHMRQVAESIATDIEARYADKFNVKDVNRTIGDYIRARNELQNLDGSVVKGGGLSRKLAQLGGAVIAGPLSNIPLVDNLVGGYIAGKVQQYAVSPARKLSGLDSANISNPAPDVLNTAEEGARSAAARQAALPRLPAPRTPLPDPLAQYTPSKSGLLSQEEARAALRGTVLDPTRAGQTTPIQQRGYVSPFYGEKPLMLPAPGQLSQYTLPGRSMPDFTPSPLYKFPPAPQPKTTAQIRLEMLQEAAEKNKNASFLPRPRDLSSVEPRVMSEDLPKPPTQSPNLLDPRQVDSTPRMTPKETAQIKKTTDALPTAASLSLLNEARKYKTADEFVKAQGVVFFRGGLDLSNQKMTDAGISISRGRGVAEDFAKQKGGNVEEIILSPSAKIIEYSNIPDVRFKHINDYSPELDVGNKQIWADLETEYQKAIDWANTNGYDGVKLPLEGETRIINPNVISQKTKLIDYWNQANKNTPK